MAGHLDQPATEWGDTQGVELQEGAGFVSPTSQMPNPREWQWLGSIEPGARHPPKLRLPPSSHLNLALIAKVFSLYGDKEDSILGSTPGQLFLIICLSITHNQREFGLQGNLFFYPPEAICIHSYRTSAHLPESMSERLVIGTLGYGSSIHMSTRAPGSFPVIQLSKSTSLTWIFRLKNIDAISCLKETFISMRGFNKVGVSFFFFFTSWL